MRRSLVGWIGFVLGLASAVGLAVPGFVWLPEPIRYALLLPSFVLAGFLMSRGGGRGYVDAAVLAAAVGAFSILWYTVGRALWEPWMVSALDGVDVVLPSPAILVLQSAVPIVERMLFAGLSCSVGALIGSRWVEARSGGGPFPLTDSEGVAESPPNQRIERTPQG